MKKWFETKEDATGITCVYTYPTPVKISLKSLEGKFYCDFSPCIEDCEQCVWGMFPEEIKWN